MINRRTAMCAATGNPPYLADWRQRGDNKEKKKRGCDRNLAEKTAPRWVAIATSLGVTIATHLQATQRPQVAIATHDRKVAFVGLRSWVVIITLSIKVLSLGGCDHHHLLAVQRGCTARVGFAR